MPRQNDTMALPPLNSMQYDKQKESFISDLKQFHASRRTFFKYEPCIGGKSVDLYLLYSKVCSYGGWEKLVEKQKQEEIQELFNLPKACTNSSLALRNIYLRFLEIYEKINFHGEDPERVDYDLDDSSMSNMDGSFKRSYVSIKRNIPAKLKIQHNTLSKMYNHPQHNIPYHMRSDLGMSINLRATAAPDCKGYEKLHLSLMSGLRNEIDFALNTCTLLSNKGKFTLQLQNQRIKGLLELLIAHCGVYEYDEMSLRPLFGDTRFELFWKECVPDDEIYSFCVCDTGTVTSDMPSVSSTPSSAFSTSRKSSEHLALNDPQGQRILQIIMVVRNLSFDADNSLIIGNSDVAFRFLMLCVNCSYNILRNLALDTLCNISTQLVLEPEMYRSTQLIFMLVHRCLVSYDKFDIVSGLDILAQLSKVHENKELILYCVDEEIYDSVCQLLTALDIQVIVHLLETFYQLSSLGKESCDLIAKSQSTIDNLVNLVTVEAQSYGANSLNGIKVVEHITNVTQMTGPTNIENSEYINTMCLAFITAYFDYTQVAISTANIPVTLIQMHSEYLSECRNRKLACIGNAKVFSECVRTVYPRANIIRESDRDRGLHRRILVRRQTPHQFPPHIRDPQHKLPPPPGTMGGFVHQPPLQQLPLRHINAQGQLVIAGQPQISQAMPQYQGRVIGPQLQPQGQMMTPKRILHQGQPGQMVMPQGQMVMQQGQMVMPQGPMLHQGQMVMPQGHMMAQPMPPQHPQRPLLPAQGQMVMPQGQMVMPQNMIAGQLKPRQLLQVKLGSSNGRVTPPSGQSSPTVTGQAAMTYPRPMLVNPGAALVAPPDVNMVNQRSASPKLPEPMPEGLIGRMLSDNTHSKLKHKLHENQEQRGVTSKAPEVTAIGPPSMKIYRIENKFAAPTFGGRMFKETGAAGGGEVKVTDQPQPHQSAIVKPILIASKEKESTEINGEVITNAVVDALMNPQVLKRKAEHVEVMDESKRKRLDEIQASRFLCEWSLCHETFDSRNNLIRHVMQLHFQSPPSSSSSSSPTEPSEPSDQPETLSHKCLWTDCEPTVRQKWCFVQHLQDKHLSISSLRCSYAKRQITNDLAQQRNKNMRPHSPAPPPQNVTAGPPFKGQPPQAKSAYITHQLPPPPPQQQQPPLMYKDHYTKPTGQYNGPPLGASVAGPPIAPAPPAQYPIQRHILSQGPPPPQHHPHYPHPQYYPTGGHHAPPIHQYYGGHAPPVRPALNEHSINAQILARNLDVGNDAVHAISRFTPKPPYHDLMEMKEGPVTKHIRLTSALILRNLCSNSAIAQSKMQRHEKKLTYMALSCVEASTALAQCLNQLHKEHEDTEEEEHFQDQ